MTSITVARTTGWLSAADCSIDEFAALVEQRTQLPDYPYADAVERNVLIYGEKLRAAVATTPGRAAVQTELMRALTDGPGIVVFKGAFCVIERVLDAVLFCARAIEKNATTRMKSKSDVCQRRMSTKV